MRSFLLTCVALFCCGIVAGCGEPQNEVVTEGGEMSIEEYNELVKQEAGGMAPAEEPNANKQ
ncbi:hypothetical protein FYK55_23700 [Roseiconus nitratireducens]|uniref:Secreted protein n=1 Tax=Roseiconus nitratireducens TaxID=2605748 RepID=A0A5M6CZW5_9BACT|nr:hypothetical protein [Roseiconus nitratireducens]KAA5539582.1 hypothetical protein FYK55_23700 [Roseiconus nitratireducens]